MQKGSQIEQNLNYISVGWWDIENSYVRPPCWAKALGSLAKFVEDKNCISISVQDWQCNF